MLHEFGLQITLKAHSHDIRTLEDVMVCFIHWRLLRYGFICMGDGPSPENIPTEVLPLNMGWDGDLRGYFLKYQVRKKQYLLSVNMDGTGDANTAEVGLLSDARVTKILIGVNDLVWKDLQINRELAEDIAFAIDTDLIQPQGFKRVDEKWLTNWDDRQALLDLQQQNADPGTAEGGQRAIQGGGGTGQPLPYCPPCPPCPPPAVAAVAAPGRRRSLTDVVRNTFTC